VSFCLQLLKEKTDGRLLVEALVPDFQVGETVGTGGDKTDRFSVHGCYCSMVGTSALNRPCWTHRVVRQLRATVAAWLMLHAACSVE
jgi:hypothetical protein